MTVYLLGRLRAYTSTEVVRKKIERSVERDRALLHRETSDQGISSR